MKVLFFPYYPNNPYQPNLAKELAALGFDVEGVKNVSLFTLFEAINGKNKIYHLHWTDPYIVSDKLWISMIKASLFLLILAFLKLRGRKLVWTIHNLGGHEKKQRRFELFVHRLLAKLCAGIIVHNRYAKEKVIGAYRLEGQNDKVQIIPHGNYIGNYPDSMPRGQARQLFNLSADQKVFLFLGQIRHYKGVPDLVAAFSQVATGNAVLILAGRSYDQKTHDEVTRLVDKNEDIIYIPGFVPEDKIQEYMKAADVVVFPFRNIFTSGSILLAMSFGKAIILPKIDSLQEFIDVGGAITFSPGQANSLKIALKTALTADLERLGARNLEAAQALSWNFIAKKTASIYENHGA